MNVIIRLQNLPWSANASDIRQFFKNCAIPEGKIVNSAFYRESSSKKSSQAEFTLSVERTEMHSSLSGSYFDKRSSHEF